MSATILVVDADPSNRSSWETLLVNQGYNVIATQSEEAALTLCPGLQPDLVLLNEFMPDAQGAELCRRLKADPRNRLTPVVLVSLNGNTSAAQALEAGADDFWGHPASPWEALIRVNSMLQMKAYIDEQAESVVFSLVHSIEARYPFDVGHSTRVSNNAVRFGKSLGLNQADLDTLRIGGLVHDIGKIGIPESVLSKPGPLDSEESKIVQQHPLLGEQICAPLKSFRHVLPLIRHHHERMNGTGYPDGLKGEQIPLTVRIIQIVDICDALTSNRAYRRPLSLPSALVILTEEADRGWLDKDLVRQFTPIAVGLGGAGVLATRGKIRIPETPNWFWTSSSAELDLRRA